MRLEHQIEPLRFRPIETSAGGTFHFLRNEHRLYLIKIENRSSSYAKFVFKKFIPAKSLPALATIDQRIGKPTDVAGGFPCLGVHQNRCIEPHHIVSPVHECLPPLPFHAVFHFYPKRSVVTCIGQPSVDFRSWKNKSPAFAEGDDLIEGSGGHRRRVKRKEERGKICQINTYFKYCQNVLK